MHASARQCSAFCLSTAAPFLSCEPELGLILIEERLLVAVVVLDNLPEPVQLVTRDEFIHQAFFICLLDREVATPGTHSNILLR